MNLPRYIQPVAEGESRTCVSPEVWEPIVALAYALKNIRGANCDVYMSDGRFVLDMINSTRTGIPKKERPPDYRPPPYRPPPGGWDGNGGEPPPAGAPGVTPWYAAKYCRHAKTGFIPFTDYAYETDPYTKPGASTDISYSQNISGTFYLSMFFSATGSYLQLQQEMQFPGSTAFRQNHIASQFGGPPFEDISPVPGYALGGVNTFQYTAPTGTLGNPLSATINRRGYGYMLQNPVAPGQSSLPTTVLTNWIGETPQAGTAEITLNRYTEIGQRNNLYFYNSGSFDFIDRNNWIPQVKGELVVDLGKAGTKYTHFGVSVELDARYMTFDLYTDCYTLLTSILYVLNTTKCATFVQPSGGSSSTSSPSAGNYSDIVNGPSGGAYYTRYDTIPISESVFSSTNQNVVTDSVNTEPSWATYGAGISYGAMHFRRAAVGLGGTFEAPAGLITDLQRRKCMVGNYTTIYVAKYSVPTQYLAPSFPSARMPSSAQFVEVVQYNIGAGNNETLYSGDSPEYSVWATTDTAALRTPPTPVVYTSGANAPTLAKSGLDVTYTFYHGEPYLTWRIYRNTVNNSGTATLVSETTGICNREISDGVFRMVYTETVPSVGTYYYWHKAFYDSSRVSGFSAVTSITV